MGRRGRSGLGLGGERPGADLSPSVSAGEAGRHSGGRKGPGSAREPCVPSGGQDAASPPRAWGGRTPVEFGGGGTAGEGAGAQSLAAPSPGIPGGRDLAAAACSPRGGDGPVQPSRGTGWNLLALMGQGWGREQLGPLALGAMHWRSSLARGRGLKPSPLGV